MGIINRIYRQKSRMEGKAEATGFIHLTEEVIRMNRIELTLR